MVAKYSEKYDADSKQSTADFEESENITVYSSSVIQQKKKVKWRLKKGRSSGNFLWRMLK